MKNIIALLQFNSKSYKPMKNNSSSPEVPFPTFLDSYSLRNEFYLKALVYILKSVFS